MIGGYETASADVGAGDSEDLRERGAMCIMGETLIMDVIMMVVFVWFLDGQSKLAIASCLASIQPSRLSISCEGSILAMVRVVGGDVGVGLV
jgi:hypothetical protein